MASPLSPSGRQGQSSSKRLDDDEYTSGSDSSSDDSSSSSGSSSSESSSSESSSSESSSSESTNGEGDDYYDSEAVLSQNLSTKFQSNKGYDSRMSMDSFVDEEEYTEGEPEGPSQHYSRRNSDLSGNVGVFEQMGMKTEARDDQPKHSAFPSNKLLIFMVIFIIVALGAFVGCLLFFVYEPAQIAPEIPDGAASEDGGTTGGRDIPQPPAPTISIPDDEELMEIFEGLGFGSVNDTSTDLGMAAQWMLNEDPGKTDPTLLPRSEDGWAQRFTMAYFYFANTEVVNNTRSEWVSCNPPAEGEDDLCEFSAPIYLPNGDIIYDSIPSYRWLSGADECLWGGVACGTTIYDTENTFGNGPIYRSAVTSIELGAQNLTGPLLDDVLSLPELQVLDLSNNGLEGSLSAALGELTRCKLSNNKITGSIPALMLDESSPLEDFDVSFNLLTGSIPEGFQLSTSLKSLSVADNDMIGTIPFLGNMPLEVFYGQNNSFTGIIPFDYGYDGLWPSTLKEWVVSNNKLTGALPQGLGYVFNLEDLRVDNNMLVGTIPESIGTLDRLYRFDAQVNFLTGTIPESITSLDSLEELRLQFNGLTGEVPTDLCLVETMVILEANCAFTEEERQSAVIETNNDIIPVFGSLQEAIAAAQAGVPATAAPTMADATPAPQPFQPSDVDCACCTTCCDPDSGECLKFSTNEITVTTLEINEILV